MRSLGLDRLPLPLRLHEHFRLYHQHNVVAPHERRVLEVEEHHDLPRSDLTTSLSSTICVLQRHRKRLQDDDSITDQQRLEPWPVSSITTGVVDHTDVARRESPRPGRTTRTDVAHCACMSPNLTCVEHFRARLKSFMRLRELSAKSSELTHSPEQFSQASGIVQHYTCDPQYVTATLPQVLCRVILVVTS